jgi:hypothetical protein
VSASQNLRADQHLLRVSKLFSRDDTTTTLFVFTHRHPRDLYQYCPRAKLSIVGAAQARD